MDRHHAWIATAAALTSSAWLVVNVMGEVPAAPDVPVIQLLAPEFDDSAELEAPSPATRVRKSAGANRTLGLGFPGQSNAKPRTAATRQSLNSEIQRIQATDAEPQRLELPVQSSEIDDPLPPSADIERSRSVPPELGTSEEIAPSEEMPTESEAVGSPGTPVLMRDAPSELGGASLFAPPYLPSNQDPDALPWTAAFEDRAARAPVVEDMDVRVGDLSELPASYVPWWISELPNSIRPDKTTVPVDVDSLVTGALQFAPQILGIRTQPDINNSILAAENSAFDWTAYVDSKWSDLNDPVGNTLTTGNNSNRFIDQIATNQAGLKRRNEYGGQFDISQKLGWQDNNSRFLVPSPQGTTRLQMNYTQPLLNGSGVAYNQSRIVLAQIELNRSFDVVQEELQNHLIKVTEAYWDLYRSRVIYLQRRRVYDRAEYILDTLGGREEIDALQRQVNRAKAAVASRRSEIVRAQSAIRNAESRLRLLVNDPQFLDLSTIELVPIEAPRSDHLALSLSGSLQQALQYRPDISQAVHDLRSAGVRIGVSQKELLPKLDLVLSTYVAGLEGQAGVFKSLGNQYAEGRPGYTVGTQFEMPLGNRAAKARLDRRQWELTKAVYDFRTVVETGLTDVELAVREAETSYREMLGKFQSVIAAETESSYLEDRWKVLPGGDRGTTLLLEDLLDAQQRQADAEGEFVQSQVAYSIALIRVRRAMGVLLIAQNPTRYEEISTPQPTPHDMPTTRVTVPDPVSESDEEHARPFPPLVAQAKSPPSAAASRQQGTAKPVAKSGTHKKKSNGPIAGERTTRVTQNDEIWSRR